MNTALICTAALTLMATSGNVVGQTASTAAQRNSAKEPTLARTPDGKPDLQGVWNNTRSVPLERPKRLGTKEFYADEAEAKAAAKVPPVRVSRFASDAEEVHYDSEQFGLREGRKTVAPTLRTSLIVGPEGRIPEMTPEAKKRVAEREEWRKVHEFDSYETRELSERCILWPHEGPPMVPTGYNSNLQIVQGSGYVAILQEMIHDVRIIPTDGRPHIPANIRQWMGDSRGHWEGNTLVVDTTNFTDQTRFQNSTEKLHVIERFTRVADDVLKYEFTVSDPSTWEKSWSAEILMAKMNTGLFEYACHEGNYGLPNILSGARAVENKK